MWKTLPTWAALSVRTVGHQQRSKQGWGRLRVPSPNSVPSGSLSSTALKQRCSYIIAMSCLSCYVVQRVGEWSKQTLGDWKCSTTDVSGEYARSFGPTKSPTMNFSRKQGAGPSPRRLQMSEMARTCAEDGAAPHHKGCLKMDTTRQKKTWETQNHLAQNCDT